MSIHKEKIILEKCHNNNLIYILLGELISSDNNFTEGMLNTNLSILKAYNRAIRYTNIEKDDKKEYSKFIKNGIEILKNELKKYDKRRLHVSP